QQDHLPGRYALDLSHTPYPKFSRFNFTVSSQRLNLLSISSFEESASSNQNHPAEIRGSEAHTDDTSGIDDDSNRHDTEGAKVMQMQYSMPTGKVFSFKL
uniref:Uncharacterized protein n=1 Tax=Solanum lycopersicum TaxID=4081 RepID=A0A3Q7I1P0_SOLLC